MKLPRVVILPRCPPKLKTLSGYLVALPMPLLVGGSVFATGCGEN